ncbi:aminopeptidase N [Legionella genomosp. 1]|uniref:aminopeptidase N n=1 Tax=Legionella genomosp. 1 TaxID=1093625 RepID=UPI001055D712|nr:aminopeptidase N [Legionella genomosp. 1]
MSNTTIYRKNYQPPVFSIEKIDLDFDLYDDHAMVENHMRLKRRGLGALRLDGDELELVSIKLNNIPLNEGAYYRKDNDLVLPDCPDEFELTIVTRIRPQDNTQLSGLYRSNHLFCTQCEAEGFRRITFFPDRPDVLTVFTTRIKADKEKYPVLLSNGNLVDSGELPGGRHWAVWQDPFKKPSYLFALVAGRLVHIQDEFITRSGNKVDCRIYVEPGNEDKCQHAMNSLKNAMTWDEEVYGREYDLSIFMIVAVSDFNMGAMENKGLNIFNSKYILARPETATDQDFADVEGVVGHEYFHNWTGNRVTCRDWFQLSLKEGLTVFRDQEFSRDMNSRDVNRILDVKMLRTTQFPEDAGSMAHPVRPDSYQEINNFYTATIYNKGAEVIRMQHTILGKEGFRRGMDLYFERHDGQAVTIDDFVAAMEDANGVDLTQFKLWYSQAGTPEIEIKSVYKDGELSLHMKQHCPPTPECEQKQAFHIPIRIALFDTHGKELEIEKDVLELKEEEQTFRIPNLPEKPVVSLLRDFSAPVKLKREINRRELLSLLRFETDGVAKWDAAQCLTTDCIGQFLKQDSSQWQIPNDLINACQHVLHDKSLDRALKAELLTPPGFEEIITNFHDVDVDLLEAARDAYRSQLGKALYESLVSEYLSLWQKENHTMNASSYSRRRLRNTVLWFMMKAEEETSLTLCQQQYAGARTMSDQISSFALLVNSHNHEAKQQAISRFYEQWANNELVLDKWFAIQASCEDRDTLQHVRKLLQHPAFSIKNPNKVRALIGSFCQANPRNFHAMDGRGYEFLTEMLLQMDQINPQIAARLATPFTRWQQYNLPRQSMMQNQLHELARHKLSNDLKELVTKSMA